MTQKREFEATEGLLHDVMRKQAGTVEKAVLEAVMNSVDANAKTIEVEIRPNGMVITDDGDGMGKEEIESYFQKFGLKDDDIEDKEFGKFRMGRGQIFNFGKNIWHTENNVMVVNLNEDTAHVVVDEESHELDTSGLSYNLLETQHHRSGCEIEVEFYKTLDDLNKTVSEIKKHVEFIPWLHNVNLLINDEEVDTSPTPDFETEEAFFFYEPEEDIRAVTEFMTQTSIYNKGAYVKDESIAPVTSVVVTKQDLDVNFARNDILDTDDLWSTIVDDFEENTAAYLIEKRDFNQKQAKWLLEQARTDADLLMEIRTIPLVEDIENNKWSMEELSGQDISFTHSGNKAAEDLMEQTGVLFLKEDFEGLIHDVVEDSDVLEYEDVLDDHNTFEMSTIEDDDLSKRRKERLSMARWFIEQFGYNQDVKAGYSKNANVWQDDDNTLYIHKGLLNEDKDTFLTEGLNEILIVAAHDEDTRQGRSEGHGYRRNLGMDFGCYGEVQKQLLNGSADYEGY